VTQRSYILVALATALMAMPRPVKAQEADSSLVCSDAYALHGAIAGTIRQRDGAAASGVIVGAADLPGRYCFVHSDAAGRFVLPRVPVGENLVIGRLGSHFTEPLRVEVSSGVELSLTLMLGDSPPDPWEASPLAAAYRAQTRWA
jgi:hypothetical protein